MTREEHLYWLNKEIETWENDCKSKHPIKEALYAARKALEQEPCEDAVSVTSVFEIMGNLLSIPYDFDRSITEKDVSESMDKIRELPSVTPQEPRWIPVNERLPNNPTNGDVIKALFNETEYPKLIRLLMISDSFWKAPYKGGQKDGNDN